VTLSFRRLLSPVLTLSLAVFSLPALQAQAPAKIGLTLPEAPKPQLGTELADASMESSSSSIDEALAEQALSSQITPPQAPNTPPGQSSTPMTEEQRREASEAELKKELHQRLGGVVPNFNAVLDGVNLPLTPGQKMRAAFRAAIDPYQFGLAAFTSSIGQAENSHSSYTPIAGTDPTQYFEHGYRQGWLGYGKRFGAAYTDQFDGTILGNGLFPVLLHQDSRYYRMGTGSFKKRFLYSIGTTVYCKGDNGKWQPNVSNLLGNLASGGISNLYYPAADRGFDLTIEQGFLVTAEGVFGALAIEFYPDIVRHFHKGHLPPDPKAIPSDQP
jgi:hypothetical protein